MILLNHEEIQVNIQDDKRRTPLHHAIMRNHSAIAKILLDNHKKANPKVNYQYFMLKNISNFA